MHESAATITIDLRIPGKWSNPRELIERLPKGCRLTPETLVMPDGKKVDFGAVDADDKFAKIFHSSCRQPPTEEELETVDGYTVNVLLSGPGGSMEAAHAMMKAGAAIVRAGGAGVFNDNSALAHSGQNWLAMADDGGTDALSFAFVAIVHGKTEVWTMGMHVLGFRDIVMKRADIQVGGFDIVEMIRYVCRNEKPIENAHLIADLDGPRFQVFTVEGDPNLAGTPMHNPYGRLKLVSIRDLAESN